VDSPWPFRDSKVLLLILLGRGRHIEGGVGFTVDADGIYIGLTRKGGRLSKGYPEKIGIQNHDNIETL
jgi:hypothetical protein